jgi:predicted amidohydrolase YtcJ
MRAFILVSLFSCFGATAAAAPAELILQHGDIATGDAAHPHASAVAIQNGLVVAVGSEAEVAPFAGNKTRVVELGGRAVIPALTDAHAHLFALGEAMIAVDLRGCNSPDACAQKLAGKHAKGWLLGRGWDQNLFSPAKFPTRAPLDRVVTDGPAWLERIDGHAGWANSKALAAAKIDRDTKDPPGGRILRDDKGEPTGILVDAAMSLVERAMPAATPAEIEAAILRAQDYAVAEGLTSVHEMGIGAEVIDVYRALATEGRLKLRVYAFAGAADADHVLLRAPDDNAPGSMFALRGIKLYADGALGSRGASLMTPYSDDPQNRGLVLMPGDAIEGIARRARKAGWQVAVHAIGDRANHDVLEAFARAGVVPADRFRIEHAQIVELDDIARFARLGVIASMQPVHAVSDQPWVQARLGKTRLAGAYAWRRMLQAGVHLAFGSDFPVEEPSLVAGLRAAVARPWTQDQRVTLDEAIAAYTTGAAYASFSESWRGRLAVGQAADLTVFAQPLSSLTSSRAMMTVVGGRVVFERP